MSTYEPEYDPDYVEAAQEPAPHPFVAILNNIPAEQRVSMYDALLAAAAAQLTNSAADKRLLETQLAKVLETQEVRSRQDQNEGFGRALSSVRASLEQWPEGACDHEIARLASLIVHNAVTDQAGTLWVSIAVPPQKAGIGKQFIVAILRVNLPPSLLTRETAYWQAITTWAGERFVMDNNQTAIRPDYWHSLPRNPHSVFGSANAGA